MHDDSSQALSLEGFQASRFQMAETLFLAGNVRGVVAHHDQAPDKMPSKPPSQTLQPVMARHVQMVAVDTAAVMAQTHWQQDKEEQRQTEPPQPVTMFTETVILLLAAVIFGWLVAHDIGKRKY